MNRKAWFRPKRLGWGRAPDGWQGWAVTAAAAAAIVMAARVLH